MPERSVPTVCTLLIEPQPASGAWNMAVDGWLLQRAVGGPFCALRLYTWSPATLSLGYFQASQPVDARWSALPRVRRLSGGGAILHDRELTYSLAVSAEHPWASQPRTMYERVHGSIIAELARIGVRAALRGDDARRDELAGRFLCFERGDVWDVVVEGRKILGSAQRRRQGAVLQHGSLILEASTWAPEIPGLRNLVSGLPDDEAMRGWGTAWALRLAADLSTHVERRSLTETELAEITALTERT